MYIIENQELYTLRLIFSLKQICISKKYLVIQVPHYFHSNEILCDAQSIVRYVKRELPISMAIYLQCTCI